MDPNPNHQGICETSWLRPITMYHCSAGPLHPAIGRLPNHCRWTSNRPPVCVSATKLFETDPMRIISTADMVPHSSAKIPSKQTLHWITRIDSWHWRPVLFTNEPRFHVSTCGRRVRVWRNAGERYTDCNVLECDRFEGGSMMV